MKSNKSLVPPDAVSDVLVHLQTLHPAHQILPIHIVHREFLLQPLQIAHVEEHLCILFYLPDEVESLDACEFVEFVALLPGHVAHEDQVGRLVVEEELVGL